MDPNLYVRNATYSCGVGCSPIERVPSWRIGEFPHQSYLAGTGEIKYSARTKSKQKKQTQTASVLGASGCLVSVGSILGGCYPKDVCRRKRGSYLMNMEARPENYLPQAGSGTDTSAGESRPLPVSADRGCPSYSGGGDVLLKWDKPFSRSGLLQRTPPKKTTKAWTRTETDQTETEDGASTGDERVHGTQKPYASPLTFFSPMASTPKNRADWKRKKSPTSQETESLDEKEDRLIGNLFDNISSINSLVDRQGPYKNTANEVKLKLRELQKLCGRVMDVRRMIRDKKEEETESTPKRARRAAVVEEKGTNTSTGGEMDGLEWDHDVGTETEWKEVKSKGKRRRLKKAKDVEQLKKPEIATQVKNVGKEKIVENSHVGNTGKNLDRTQANNRKSKIKNRKKSTARPEALLVEVKERDYATVLKEVKTGLTSEQIILSKVRKTRSGDILLEIEKGQIIGASQLKEKVSEICPNLSLRALKKSTKVIIKGLDAAVER